MKLDKVSAYVWRRAVAQIRAYGLARPKLGWKGGNRHESWVRGGVTLAYRIDTPGYPRCFVDREAVEKLVAKYFARNALTV